MPEQKDLDEFFEDEELKEFLKEKLKENLCFQLETDFNIFLIQKVEKNIEYKD